MAIESIVKLKQTYPGMSYDNIIELMKNVLHNGKAEIVSEQPALPDLSRHMIAGRAKSIKMPTDFDKRFELVGEKVPGRNYTQYLANPYGTKVNTFQRCPREDCGRVGIVSIAVHVKHAEGRHNRAATYVYEVYEHQHLNKHYKRIATYDEALTWKDILLHERRSGR
jgi:hypothetical protein